MPDIEICVNSDNLDHLAKNVTKIYQAGIARIELCSDMANDGLTPSIESISIARQAFCQRQGLMIMIRPRSGDFYYNDAEITLMSEQIRQASAAGADGVVLGALIKESNELNLEALSPLITLSKSLNLEVGLHRAFDAVENRTVALEQLITLGVNRILTSGTSWISQKPAVEGISNLQNLISQADERIAIVIAGGITPSNANNIYQNVVKNKQMNNYQSISFHAYSSVIEDGFIMPQKLDALINAFN